MRGRFDRPASVSVASVTAFPGTAVSTNTGDKPWSNPSNVTADDGTNATQANSGSKTAVNDSLDCDNFDFSSIPSGATIDGIEVVIERAEGATGNNIYDYTVQLFKAGSLTGDNKADTVNEWPTTITAKTYGGAADLWGTTWTDSDVKDPDFGVRMTNQKVSSSSSSGSNTVDYVKVTVHYTESSSFVPRLSLLGVG